MTVFFYFQFIYNCIKKEAVRATSFLKGGLPFCIKKITKILVLDIKTIFLSYIEFEPVQSDIAPKIGFLEIWKLIYPNF